MQCGCCTCSSFSLGSMYQKGCDLDHSLLERLEKEFTVRSYQSAVPSPGQNKTITLGES